MSEFVSLVIGPQSRSTRLRTRTAARSAPVTVELKPGETEIIGSNLDSQETAQLLELAKTAFEREVSASAKLRQRARAAAERAITSLLLVVGFTDVRFVDVLPDGAGSLT